ncbi:MAG: RagB/SusD family nutrient uptake outer membrane protein [Chitinophaga sp.]|uniref:RagB/SusD family nutrient uptake outer membrane protein n=1 Tax=Chitinophaga sp. TaxID=1869181 RepID=UPI001AFE34A7|nr:RagB/SusD family nutrient uptake outer membrane protein [Chitinophaga sp.]MBO9731934.1 RagB/SusD family nutrient uptake outer membrane protein [Chitinophaga sp.]
MKSYKKYVIPFLLAVSVAGLPACNKKLDVEPGSYIVPGQVQNESDVSAELMGAYANLQHYNLYGERAVLIPDLLAAENELSFEGTFLPYRQFQDKSQLKTSGIAEGIWQRGYKTINNVNIVIANIGLVSADNKKQIEGEARFIRGLLYFQLCNLYGLPYSAGAVATNPAVPLILDPIIAQEDLPKANQARASVDAIHKQVLLDLQFAAANLPEAADNGRATKYAASAILSRVYMAEGLYKEAAEAANDVIESGAYTLASSFDKAFNNATNSTEDVFAIQQTNQSNAGTVDNGLQTFYASRDFGGRGDINVDLSVLPYAAGDDRKTFSYEGDGIAGNSGDYSAKWKQQYKVYTVVRLGELLLTRAESNLRAGTTVGADPLDDVNAVRKRSHASVLTAVTPDIVVQERIRELAFEGDKLWTYKRLKKSIGTYTYTDNMLVLPVPQRETDANTKLTQNPGY